MSAPMSPARIVRLVARREVRERLRSKEMVVSTLISLAVIAVIVLAAGAADSGGPSFDVGTVGERPAQVAAVMDDLAGGEDGRSSGSSSGGDSGSDGVELDVRQVEARAEAERLVRDGDLDAVIVDDEVLVGEELDRELGALVHAAHREVAIAGALSTAGATPDEVASASPGPLTARALDPVDEDQEDRTGLATIGTFLLYVQLFGFGYWVASGIVEEKSSRVVEILLAKAGPRPLLAGKVLGIGILGLAQLVLFVVVGLGLATALGSVDLPSGTGRTAVELVAWFLLGYAVYACLFAMGGAIASRAEELQNSTGPISLVAMGGFFAAVATSGDPEGLIARITTYVPVAAPMVLPIRSAAGALPLWEAALSVVLVLLSTVLMVRLTARIYAGGVLFTRGPLKMRDALARSRTDAA
jgi:ABC-2 type transport system permease protein